MNNKTLKYSAYTFGTIATFILLAQAAEILFPEMEAVRGASRLTFAYPMAIFALVLALVHERKQKDKA